MVDIKLYENNAKIHNDKQLEALAKVKRYVDYTGNNKIKKNGEEIIWQKNIIEK